MEHASVGRRDEHLLIKGEPRTVQPERWLSPGPMMSNEEKQRASDLSLCATLISLFDFNALGEVSLKDWERGTSTLLLGELGKDADLWQRLLSLYDPKGTGAVQLDRVRDLLPIDPRITVLLQQLVHAVAGCREFVAGALQKAEKTTELRANRAIINIRKKMMQPVFEGWRDAIRTDLKLRNRSARFLRSQTVGKAWRTWRDLAEAKAESRARMSKMLRRMLQRGLNKALLQWLDWYDEAKRQQGLLRRALSPLTRAWNQWKGLSEQAAHLKAVLRRGLGGGGLSKAFNTWLEYLDEQGAALSKTKRLGAQLMGGPLAKAWNTWRGAICAPSPAITPPSPAISRSPRRGARGEVCARALDRPRPLHRPRRALGTGLGARQASARPVEALSLARSLRARSCLCRSCLCRSCLCRCRVSHAHAHARLLSLPLPLSLPLSPSLSLCLSLLTVSP